MKSLNKVLSLFLCLVLFLNMVPVVQGTSVSSEDLAIVSYTVPVISNEYTNDYVTIYEHEGKFFMSLNDIGDFTRSTLTEDDETLTLTHGLREVVISKADGHMVDSGIVDQGNITLLEYNGMYLCEGIPMLQYLGAACSIHEEKELEVLMPIYTIWESIMPDYLDYYFDINELYGGENSVKISLICDILADVLDGVSGHGLFGSYDIHMEDALYEVLNVDMMKYSSVQQSAAEENQKINDFLTSDVYGFILDGSEKTVDGVYEVLDYYAGFYLNTEIWKNSYLEKLYFEAGDLKSASELGSQINKQVYTQSVMQADLKDVKANKSLLSIGMLAFDTAVTSYGLMQYDDDTRNLFARTISDEMIAHTNYHRAGWMSVSDKIANTLKSTESIVVNTAATKIAETAVDEVSKFGVQKAISGLTTKGNIYVAAAQIGLYLASLINHSSNEAYSADLNAILLNEAHFDIAMMASQLLVDERDKYHFSNPESLKRIKDMFTLYYRFVIAFSENVAKSIDEFGSRDDQKWVDWFSSTEERSVANYAAAYLYRITNCVIVPYVEYSQLTDGVITHDWVSKANQHLELSDAYFDYIYNNRYNEQYCYHIPKILLTGNNFEQLNSQIYSKLYSSLQEGVYNGTDIYTINMSYGCGQKINYASIIVSEQLDWGWTDYYVYNIDISNGHQLSVKDLLSIYGLTDENYRNLAQKALKAQYELYYREAYEDNKSNESFLSFYQQQLDATISKQNIDAVIPYIDSNGDLCGVAAIYSLAGADYYHHLINLTGTEEPAPIRCEIDHSNSTGSATGDSLQYFIENCDRHYFTAADIQDFSAEMCMYARNAIFAKAGRKFQNQELRTYFEQYSWYHPYIEPEDFQDSMLSTIQLANINLILSHEEKLEINTMLDSLTGEEGIYTRYLHNGGYEELLGQEFDKEKLQVSSCLLDLDSDGTKELFLSLGTGNYGPRGMETCTFLLDIESNQVIKATNAYFGGGSMGGDYLGIRYDKEQQKHVLVLEGHIRDGVSAHGTYLDIYSESNFKAGMELFEGYYSLYGDTYQESAAKIRAETSLYYEDGEDFRFYQINDQYVTKEAFDAAWARYEEPREGFQPKNGSFVKPIA